MYDSFDPRDVTTHPEYVHRDHFDGNQNIEEQRRIVDFWGWFPMLKTLEQIAGNVYGNAPLAEALRHAQTLVPNPDAPAEPAGPQRKPLTIRRKRKLTIPRKRVNRPG